MISEELMQALHRLNRVDKLRVIQLLAGDLTIDEGGYFINGASYDVWSPYDVPQAAEALLNMLNDDESQNG